MLLRPRLERSSGSISALPLRRRRARGRKTSDFVWVPFLPLPQLKRRFWSSRFCRLSVRASYRVSMAEKKPSGGTEDDSRQPTSSSSTPGLWMLNSKWLQIHRRSLLRDMQNAVPEVLDYLVEKGKIDPLESDVYQEIMLDTTAPLQKARKLLIWPWLATQPPNVFWSF